MKPVDSVAEQVKDLLRDMTVRLDQQSMTRNILMDKIVEVGRLVDKIDQHAGARAAMELSLLREQLGEKLDALDMALSNIDDARADLNTAREDLESHHTEAEIASQAIRKLLK